jgi:hypothetical protein
MMSAYNIEPDPCGALLVHNVVEEKPHDYRAHYGVTCIVSMVLFWPLSAPDVNALIHSGKVALEDFGGTKLVRGK